MATYHCHIKIGNTNTASAHFDYILRQGHYKNREDFCYEKSGRLPDCVNTADEFWKICNEKDKRPYRELEIALPNELTLEEQIELVDDMVENILPNNTYTYAIHENISAVHGEKNPHVHIMFNERILDDSVKNLDQETYFKQRGKSKKGEWYGGALKDKSWRGRGETAKYHEVRETVAEIINKHYKKKGLSIEVSHEKKEQQKTQKARQGKLEHISTVPSTRRIPRDIFQKNIQILQIYLKTNQDINEPLHDMIRERLKLEKAKQKEQARLMRNKVQQMNIQPDQNTIQDATESIIIHTLSSHNTNEPNETSDSVASFTYTTIEATKEAKNLLPDKLASIDKKQLHSMVRDLSITLHKLKRLKNIFEQKEKENIITKYMDKKTNGRYSQLLARLEDQPKDLKTAGEKIDLEKIYIKDPELQDVLFALFKKQKENPTILDERIALLKEIKEVLMKHKEYDPNTVETLKRKKEKVTEKHTTRKVAVEEFDKHKTDEHIKEVEKRLKMRSPHYWYDRLINEKSGGQLKIIQEKIRSKESLLDYEKREGKDTKTNEKLLEKLYRQEEQIYRKYDSPDIRKQAEALAKRYGHIVFRNPFKPRLDRLTKLPNIPWAKQAASRLDNLLTPSDTPALGAANVRVHAALENELR